MEEPQAGRIAEQTAGLTPEKGERREDQAGVHRRAADSSAAVECWLGGGEPGSTCYSLEEDCVGRAALLYTPAMLSLWGHLWQGCCSGSSGCSSWRCQPATILMGHFLFQGRVE